MFVLNDNFALSTILLLAAAGCSSPPPPTSTPSSSVPTQADEETAEPAEASPASPGEGASVAPPDRIPPWCGDDPTTPKFENLQLRKIEAVKNHFDGFGNIEGPVWIDGALYYSNISGGENPPASVIWRLIPGEEPEVFMTDSGSNGLATDGAGGLILAQHSSGALSRRLLSAPDLTPLATQHDESRFNSPNDLVLSSDGTLYFTDPTWQAPSPHPQTAARAYATKAGKVSPLDTAGAPENPNGVMLSLDEKFLYLGGVNGLYKYELGSDGAVVVPGSHLTTKDLAKNAGIDGLGKDCSGNIYVTVHGNKDVVVLDPSDRQIGRIDVPSVGGVTNVAFGGADHRTLFITSLGTPPEIHTVHLGVAGFAY